MDQDLVGWICSIIVILSLIGLVLNELVKRWNIGVRLSVLDESLLEEDNIASKEGEDFVWKGVT